jgi:hypothetical protein
MSEQVHAPPLPHEAQAIDLYRTTHGPATPEDVETWSEPEGWCSACRAQPTLVTHMGHDKFNFALCKSCLIRLIDDMRDFEAAWEAGTAPPGTSTAEPEKRGS